MDFADVRLPKEEHADSGLADSASDREGKSLFQDSLLEGKFSSLGAAGFIQLLAERVGVDADSHGGELKSDVQYRIIYEDVGVELPVVIVGGASVVRLAVRELVRGPCGSYRDRGLPARQL